MFDITCRNNDNVAVSNCISELFGSDEAAHFGGSFDVRQVGSNSWSVGNVLKVEGARWNESGR